MLVSSTKISIAFLDNADAHKMIITIIMITIGRGFILFLRLLFLLCKAVEDEADDVLLDEPELLDVSLALDELLLPEPVLLLL